MKYSALSKKIPLTGGIFLYMLVCVMKRAV